MLAPLQEPARARRDPNVVAMLSLYLLLLAFFILLNALSNLEEDRARVVIESVNEAFKGRVPADSSVAPYAAALGALDDSDALVDQLRNLFDSLIPAVSTDESADGPVLRLVLDAETLFQPGTARLARGRGLLFERAAKALLEPRDPPLYYELEFLHGVAESQSDAAPAVDTTLAIERAGTLVRQMVDFGLAPETLSAGLLPGREGDIQLVVRIHKEPLKIEDFGGLVE